MKILCCLVLVFTGATLATVQPKSVNLALETVLQFDKKNHEADLEVITRVQKFLDNIKDVMSVYDGSRPSRRSNHESLKFTDFILEVVNVVRSYNDSDLKQIITVLDDEARKYNYKGCKFYELLDNRSLRRFVSRNLEDAKEIPLEKLRNLLDVVATGIQNQKFKRDEKKLLSLVNSLYSGSENRFTQVLSNLNNFGTRRFSLRPNIRDIVSKGLKSIIFDFYSNLNRNARMSLKSAVHNYWTHYLNGKNRHSNVASTKREEKPKSNFIDLIDNTRYYNNDMHKWSARAKRTKHIRITTPSLRINKSVKFLKQKGNSHKRDSLGLSVDLKSLKPVFESFFKKIALSTENKKKDSSDIIQVKENKTKTKHKHVKHSKKNALDRFIQAMPMPDSLELLEAEGDAGHGKPKTVMPYAEHKTRITKKKRGRSSRNKEQISLDNFLKSKSEIRSEIRDLNEIQKKYDRLRKLQSNLSPEIKSEKEDEEIEEGDMSGFEFVIGGQNMQDMQRSQQKLKKRERIDSKKTPERENEANILSDHQAVTEVTESKELQHKKRIRTSHKAAKKPKTHRKPHKTQTPTFYLRSAKKKTQRASSSKSAHASNEGMSIESYENEHINTNSAIGRIKKGKTESVTENLDPRSTTDSNIVSILHKLEKELENVKAKIKYDATPSTDTAGVTSESHNGRRDQFPEHGSKYFQFKSNNITYNSKYISPLQLLLNKTMEKISSYINETIITNKNNSLQTDFDRSDDRSKSNERTESVITTTVTKDSKTSQESFEKGQNKRTSIEKPKKMLSKEKVRKGSQSLEEDEKKPLSKEMLRIRSLSLEEVEKQTLSKEMLRKGSQSVEGEKKSLFKEEVSEGTHSLEDGKTITVFKEHVKNRSPLEKSEKITISKEKVETASQSLEERENSTVSTEKVKKDTQSVKEVEKTTAKEKVGKGSQSLEEGERRTVPKEKVKKKSSAENEKTTVSKEKVEIVQSLEEGEKVTVSKENIGEGSLILIKDKNDTKSHDNEGEPDRTKTATTPTIGNISLSTSITNDFIKTENEDAGKFIGIVKHEASNNSDMIPQVINPARNYVLDEDGYWD